MGNGILKKTIAGVLVCFSLLAGYYAFNKFFTPREVFNAECDAAEKRYQIVDKRFDQAAKNRELRQLEDQVLYWEARELNQVQMQRYERDPMEKQRMQEDVQRIRKKKEKAEDKIYKLKNP